MSSGIPEKVNIPHDKGAVFHNAGLELDQCRCGPRACGKFLCPGHDDFHRLAALQGESDGNGLKTRFDFTTETAAHLGADHPHFAFGYAAKSRHDRPSFEDFLGAGPDRNRAAADGHERGMRFHITVMDLAWTKSV